MGLFKKKAPSISRAEALACTPIRSEQAQEKRLDSGEVLLIYPGVAPGWVVAISKKIGNGLENLPPRKLQFDELGSAVWDLLDGEKTVRHIIELFAEKYQLHPSEAEVSVTRFLKELGRRGLVGLK